MADDHSADKGFNDDELADIMSEIENLEKEFSSESKTAETKPAPKQEEEVVSSPVDEISGSLDLNESDLADAFADVKEEMPSSKKIPEPKKEASLQEVIDSDIQNALSESQVVEEKEPVSVENVVSMPGPKSPIPAHAPTQQEQQFKFEIQGQLKMRLEFMVGGHQVALSISEQEGLIVDMSGGAKFTIPLSSEKKSA